MTKKKVAKVRLTKDQKAAIAKLDKLKPLPGKISIEERRVETVNLNSIRIISNGMAEGTYIYDNKGRKLGLVESVSWEINVTDDIAKATIVVLGPKLDVVIPVDNTVIEEKDPRQCSERATWKSKLYAYLYGKK